MIDSAPRRVPPARRVGRYALYDEVGHGGTATVHLGRLFGPAGFSKTVAIKRMHPSVGRDPEVAAMFLDEARISSRIRHPNVVGTIDLLALDDDLFLVLEYVHGESLASLLDRLQKSSQPMPVPVAVHVMRDALAGLHAAHEALDERGEPLALVHRDVSPQNILVGIDGVSRVLDFGIAKALGRMQDTHTGQVKGKVAYMAPEQLLGQPVDRRTDIFAAGIVLWEALAGRRLFRTPNPGETVQRVLNAEVPRLSDFVPGVSPALADVVARAIERPMATRFASAHDFACSLEAVTELVSPRAVGEWMTHVAGEGLERRTARLRQIETDDGNWDAPQAAETEPPPGEVTNLRASRPDVSQAVPLLDETTHTRTATLPPSSRIPSSGPQRHETTPSTSAQQASLSLPASAATSPTTSVAVGQPPTEHDDSEWRDLRPSRRYQAIVAVGALAAVALGATYLLGTRTDPASPSSSVVAGASAPTSAGPAPGSPATSTATAVPGAVVPSDAAVSSGAAVSPSGTAASPASTAPSGTATRSASAAPVRTTSSAASTTSTAKPRTAVKTQAKPAAAPSEAPAAPKR
ncbi:MAG TPA: protein kinase, partial [Polyangiaceae bacterium]|nr:protein kinase [Polyangiaceae bacterium]